MHRDVLRLSERFFRDYPKQEWGYEDVIVNNRSYAVNESVVMDKPFCKLMRFHRDGLSKKAPKVLFVSALSGHHATLSKDTFKEFLPDHDVYVTDWTDARLVPLSDGPFALQDYISYVIEFLNKLGSEVHVIALCQSGPAAVVAAAVMSEEDNTCRPASMTVMASPMNMRVNPGFLSKLATRLDVRVWKLANLHKVPRRYTGAGRLVYPGALQLISFMSMNIFTHFKAHMGYAAAMYYQDSQAADDHLEFYNEYFSMLDMPAEFCLETLDCIFTRNDVAENKMMYQGKLVNTSAIVDIPLLAMEGANDDMIREGQCTAVVDMCLELPESKKEKWIQPGVGHYGIFNGSIYRSEVAPKIKAFVAAST